MYTPFEQLSNQSKIWIYASQIPFSETQKEIISNELKIFIDQWQAHGEELKASYEIKHNHFIIIGVDEDHHAPSGCSIDKSVQIIKSIEAKLNMDLTNRLVAYLWLEPNVQPILAFKIPSQIQEGALLVDTKVFDNSITALEKYKKEWIKDAHETWLNRYFLVV
jgi:predicted HTH transcriptional regulator